MKQKMKITGIALIAIIAALGFYLWGEYDGQTGKGIEIVNEAEAAGGKVTNPDGTAPDRYVYYPGTEELGKDEIRLVALGTGMPLARRSQAATCWLVELGNGDKFLFDIGTGANANLSALMIPFDFLRKVFLTHLHTDHWGDLPGLWAGGWTAGRTGPLEIWGPTGAREDMGTKYAVEHFLKAYNWDNMTRLANLPSAPGKITVHEFDFQGDNEIIYQENGVTIRSFPAIHAGDGSVSFALEWKGMKIVIGGDSMPNTWYRKYALNADVAIHECFMTPEQLVTLYNQSPQTAIGVGTYVHTPPQAFGKIMSTIKPKLAIAYHFFDEADTRYQIYQDIRETYDGPLTMAEDMLVWNITKEAIKVRKAVSPEEAWSVIGPTKPPPPDRTVPDQLSKWSLDHRWDISDVSAKMVEEFKKKYNLE
jgi:ribonuclease Z